MTSLRRLALSSALTALAALLVAAAALAQTVVSHDASGRTITFDVQTSTADTEWYASLLRAAPHGDEISRVTVRIVPASAIAGLCGADAVACYGRDTITVPDGHDQLTAHALVHEYGHHLDSAWAVSGVRELNGTPAWWAARGLATLVAQHTVAFDYSLGWDHSVAEIFAEDYAYIDLGDSYGIRWLQPPDDSLRAALLAELGAPAATGSAPTVPPTRPVVVNRSGVVARGGNVAIPFRLAGPGRRVQLAAVVAGARRSTTSARIEVVCDGAVVASKPIAQARQTVSLDASPAGPSSCTAVLTSLGSTLRYALQLRLSLAA